MDYLKGYRVVRQDPEWTNKIFVGSVILLTSMFIPLIGQLALIGWQALILRRAVHGHDTPLPRLDFDFDYLGKLVGLGFKALIARFLWTLPLVVLIGGAVVCMYVGFVAVVVGGMAAAEGGGGEGAAAFGSLGAMCCMSAGYLAIIVLSIVASVPASVAAMRAELTNDLNPALRFGEVMKFSKENFGVLIKGTLLLALVGGLLSMVGVVFCFVGVFPVAIVGMVAHAHFMAEVYKQHVAAGRDLVFVAGPDIEAPRAPPGQFQPPQTF
jgi:hypothetical protein